MFTQINWRWTTWIWLECASSPRAPQSPVFMSYPQAAGGFSSSYLYWLTSERGWRQSNGIVFIFLNVFLFFIFKTPNLIVWLQIRKPCNLPLYNNSRVLSHCLQHCMNLVSSSRTCYGFWQHFRLGQPRRYLWNRALDLSFTSVLPKNGNETEDALVILHGLLSVLFFLIERRTPVKCSCFSGSKRNWVSLLKAFHNDMPERPIYALDLRNHGSSPHAMPMTYEAMADDVQKFVEQRDLRKVTILGHSMFSDFVILLITQLIISIYISVYKVDTFSFFDIFLFSSLFLFLETLYKQNIPRSRFYLRSWVISPRFR